MDYTCKECDAVEWSEKDNELKECILCGGELVPDSKITKERNVETAFEDGKQIAEQLTEKREILIDDLIDLDLELTKKQANGVADFIQNYIT